MYADLPALRARQVTGDLLLVVWLVACAWLGQAVHDQVMGLAGPGEQTAESASGLASGLRDAGGRLDDLPLVGDEVASPFDRAATASDRLAEAGEATVHAVERLAFWLGTATGTVPALLALALRVPRRVRFAREATAGARFVDATEDLDLFALRALAHQPMHVLARVDDDPAGAWRRREPDVVRRLAELELRRSGLRLPPTGQGAG
ncbi:hypothetical protein [Nocardioides solisilvae]|uniref:hypothetical protein n=1 Tax=Nocardioides solisilvae TaxID=1542435 RepID=UPI000D74B182|nr:hypothetical protein [Nocardioides solisilvae]